MEQEPESYIAYTLRVGWLGAMLGADYTDHLIPTPKQYRTNHREYESFCWTAGGLPYIYIILLVILANVLIFLSWKG